MDGTISAAILIEASVRGALVGVLLLAAWQLLTHKPFSVCTGSGSVFLYCFSNYVIISMPGIYSGLGVAALPLIFAATMAPVFFWWFVLALVDDEFSLTLLHWAVTIAMVVIIILRHLLLGPDSDIIEVVRVAILIVLFVHAIWTAYRSLSEDLVPARRTFSRVISFSAPVFGICIALVEGWAVFNELPAVFNLLQLATLIVLVSLFTTWLTSVRGDLLPRGGVSRQVASGDEPLNVPGFTLLQELMDEGAYKTPGLTVGRLAQLAKMPEHRLRKLINQQLGYRNFSAFLNDHRIDEAKRILSDPGMADRQITSVAFDLGFSSLAPFNRAFRERTGTNPRDFRMRNGQKK